MAITWRVLTVDTDDTMKTISIQETVNGVDKKQYSVSLHKTARFSEFKLAFKQKIKRDRIKETKNGTDRTAISLLNFETFLNM